MIYPDLAFPVLPDRPYVYSNFISTIDGVVDFEGYDQRRAPLGSQTDRETLYALRAQADALIHGRKTALRMWAMNELAQPSFLEQRHQRGKKQPIWYVIFATQFSDQDAGYLVGKATRKPTIVTGSSSKFSKYIETCADVVRCGEGEKASLASLLHLLKQQGVDHLLLEGGPNLMGSFFAADLVDEIFLTIAPTIMGRTNAQTRSMVEGVSFPSIDARRFDLVSSHSQDNEVFLRYHRKQTS